MKAIPTILSALVLSVATHVSATEAIFSFQLLGSPVVGYATGGAGFVFTPLTSISVTSLGFGGDTLTNESSRVQLWNSLGTQLASTTVTTADPFLNHTYYGAITPITLSAGQTYYLGAVGVTSGLWLGNTLLIPPDPSANGMITVSPDISYLGGALGMSSNGGIPVATTGTAFYANANFQYTVVPEPSLLVPVGVGLAGFVLMRRKPGQRG